MIIPGKQGELLHTFAGSNRSLLPIVVRVTDWSEETTILENHFVRPGCDLIIHGWTRQTKILARSGDRYYAVPLTYRGWFRVRLKTYSGVRKLVAAKPRCKLRVVDPGDDNYLSEGDVVYLKKPINIELESDRCRYLTLNRESRDRSTEDKIRVPLTCGAVFEEIIEKPLTDPECLSAKELALIVKEQDVEVELVEPTEDIGSSDVDLPVNEPILLSDCIVEQAVYASLQHPDAPAFHIPLRTLIYVKLIKQLDKLSSPLVTKQGPKLSTLDRCVEELPSDVFSSLRPVERSFESQDKLDVDVADDSFDNDNDWGEDFLTEEMCPTDESLQRSETRDSASSFSSPKSSQRVIVPNTRPPLQLKNWGIRTAIAEHEQRTQSKLDKQVEEELLKRSSNRMKYDDWRDGYVSDYPRTFATSNSPLLHEYPHTDAESVSDLEFNVPVPIIIMSGGLSEDEVSEALHQALSSPNTDASKNLDAGQVQEFSVGTFHPDSTNEASMSNGGVEASIIETNIVQDSVGAGFKTSSSVKLENMGAHGLRMKENQSTNRGLTSVSSPEDNIRDIKEKYNQSSTVPITALNSSRMLQEESPEINLIKEISEAKLESSSDGKNWISSNGKLENKETHEHLMNEQSSQPSTFTVDALNDPQSSSVETPQATLIRNTSEATIEVSSDGNNWISSNRKLEIEEAHKHLINEKRNQPSTVVFLTSPKSVKENQHSANVTPQMSEGEIESDSNSMNWTCGSEETLRLPMKSKGNQARSDASRSPESQVDLIPQTSEAKTESSSDNKNWKSSTDKLEDQVTHKLMISDKSQPSAIHVLNFPKSQEEIYSEANVIAQISEPINERSSDVNNFPTSTPEAEQNVGLDEVDFSDIPLAGDVSDPERLNDTLQEVLSSDYQSKEPSSAEEVCEKHDDKNHNEPSETMPYRDRAIEFHTSSDLKNGLTEKEESDIMAREVEQLDNSMHSGSSRLSVRSRSRGSITSIEVEHLLHEQQEQHVKDKQELENQLRAQRQASEEMQQALLAEIQRQDEMRRQQQEEIEQLKEEQRLIIINQGKQKVVNDIKQREQQNYTEQMSKSLDKQENNDRVSYTVEQEAERGNDILTKLNSYSDDSFVAAGTPDVRSSTNASHITAGDTGDKFTIHINLNNQPDAPRQPPSRPHRRSRAELTQAARGEFKTTENVDEGRKYLPQISPESASVFPTQRYTEEEEELSESNHFAHSNLDGLAGPTSGNNYPTVGSVYVNHYEGYPEIRLNRTDINHPQERSVENRMSNDWNEKDLYLCNDEVEQKLRTSHGSAHTSPQDRYPNNESADQPESRYSESITSRRTSNISGAGNSDSTLSRYDVAGLTDTPEESHPTLDTAYKMDSKKSKLKIPDDGNISRLSSKNFLEILDFLKLSEEARNLCKEKKMDGKDFYKLSDQELVERGLAHPVLLHFKGVAPKKNNFIL